MGKQKEIKTSRVTIEFKDNGFTVEVYAFNPYGDNKQSTRVTRDFGEVLSWLGNEHFYNQRIEAEKNTEQVAA
jgi:hypothetical protein